jgi:F0F1-type ATP synthase epsilon subunit
MRLTITSASWNVLQAEKFEKIRLMTEDGEITVLSGHEPLLSAIRPGILNVDYYIGGKLHVADYAIGGGVLNISPEECVIVVDVVQKDDNLTDLEYIESQKKEAEKLIKEYKAENGTTIDPHKLIELEYELLKYTAMHRLGQQFQENKGGRK